MEWKVSGGILRMGYIFLEYLGKNLPKLVVCAFCELIIVWFNYYKLLFADK